MIKSTIPYHISDSVTILLFGSCIVIFHHGTRTGDFHLLMLIFQILLKMVIDKLRSIVRVDSSSREGKLVHQTPQGSARFILPFVPNSTVGCPLGIIICDRQGPGKVTFHCCAAVGDCVGVEITWLFDASSIIDNGDKCL